VRERYAFDFMQGITPAQIAFWEDALARAFEGDEWKAWTAKNDAAAPALRGAALQKYLAEQYNYTRGVLLDLGLRNRSIVPPTPGHVRGMRARCNCSCR